MKVHHLFVLLFVLLKAGLSLAQQTDFCAFSYKELEVFVGKELKIYDTGGIYPTINGSDHFKGWPSEEIRRSAGRSGWGDYEPAPGDIGTLLRFYRRAANDYLLLLKVGGHYVVIGCGSVVKADELDLHEESDMLWKRDSIRNLAYANGCYFKLDNRNGGCWSGHSDLGKAADAFACSLLTRGIDTVLSLYYHGGNGETIYAWNAVFWADKGTYHLQHFSLDKNDKLVTHAPVALEADNIFGYFSTNDIAGVTTLPKATLHMSHDFSYSVKFYASGPQYCGSLDRLELKDDPEHPLSKWWRRMIAEVDNL